MASSLTPPPPPASSTIPANTPPSATNIFIDRVDGYSALPQCAVHPLNTIVRDMWAGCGDGSQLTSYSCFCTNSYSRFSWQISTAVVANCGAQREEMATSAVDVFHAYCTVGREQLTDSRWVVVSSTPAVTKGSGFDTTDLIGTTSILGGQTQSPSSTSRILIGRVTVGMALILVVGSWWII